MVLDVSGLRTNFNDTIRQFGNQVRFIFFTATIGSVYDDDRTLTVSGNELWTSGIVQNIGGPINSFEGQLMFQGKINTNDTRMYVLGTVPTSGTFRVGVGSPTDTEYALTDAGMVFEPPSENEIVYKKLFLKALELGSLTGE